MTSPPLALRVGAVALLAVPSPTLAQAPSVPRTWDEQRLATMELPNAATGTPAKHVDAAYYYSVPAAVIYRTYPIYDPDHEPAGYIEELLQKEPEVVFDAAALHGEADWIRAGEHVFHWPTQLRESTPASRARFWERARSEPPDLTKDGVLPYNVYTIREKGKLEVGSQSCAMCHTRLMPDGTTIVGAQGTIPFDRDSRGRSPTSHRRWCIRP